MNDSIERDWRGWEKDNFLVSEEGQDMVWCVRKDLEQMSKSARAGH